MSTEKHHFKVESLPEDIVAEVQRLITKGEATYSDIAQHLAELGHPVSRSAVGRYGQHLLSRRRNLEATVEVAKELTQLTDQVSLEALASSLALDRIVEVLMTQETSYIESFGVSELTAIMRAVSSMQGASIARQKWEAELAERMRRTADEAARLATQGGLGDQHVDLIRKRILGMFDAETPAP